MHRYSQSALIDIDNLFSLKKEFTVFRKFFTILIECVGFYYPVVFPDAVDGGGLPLRSVGCFNETIQAIRTIKRVIKNTMVNNFTIFVYFQ